MDQHLTPVQVEMPGAEIATTTVALLSSQQDAVHAIALRWALAELLGRCFALTAAQTAEREWDGDKLISLQEVYSPREKIRALMLHIRFLADALGASSCLIDHENDPDIGRPYLDVLAEDVKLLTRHDNDAMTIELLRGKVNERLFFWDLRIHAMLQDRATAIPKVTGNFRGTVIDNIRHSTQQDAVNKATFIPPASVNPKVVQNAQAKG